LAETPVAAGEIGDLSVGILQVDAVIADPSPYAGVMSDHANGKLGKRARGEGE
jgi:hypothetical protein